MLDGGPDDGEVDIVMTAGAGVQPPVFDQVEQLTAGAGLVSRPSGSWHKSRRAAPGWQGATTENTGSI